MRTDWYSGLGMEMMGTTNPANMEMPARGLGNQAILFVSHEASRTGAPIALLNLITYLRPKLPHRFRTVFRASGPMETCFGKYGEVRVCGRDVIPGELLEGASLIYSNTASNGLFVGSLPYGDIPILTHVHEMECAIELQGRDNLSEIQKQTAHYIACSRAVAGTLVKVYAIAPERISIIPEAILPAEVHAKASLIAPAELRKSLGIGEDEPVILGCGPVDLCKGADILLQVAQYCNARASKRIHFLWIGMFSNEFAGRLLKRDLQKLGMEKYVRFLGEQANPYPYLNIADVCCLPSREDSFPHVMLESGFLGKPTLAFEGSGGAEEYCHKGGGFLVPYLDARSMAEWILGHIDCRAELSAAGLRAKRLVEEEYTLDRTGPIFEDLIRRFSRPENLAPPGMAQCCVPAETGRMEHNSRFDPAPERARPAKEPTVPEVCAKNCDRIEIRKKERAMNKIQADFMLGYAGVQRRVFKLWLKKVQNRVGCIWGGGLSGEVFYLSLLRLGARIELVVDSDPRLWGNKFAGCVPIESPDKLAEHREKLEFICVASSSPTAAKEITKAILQIPFSRSQVLRSIDLWPKVRPGSGLTVPQPKQSPENMLALSQPLPSDLRWMRQAARGMSDRVEFIIHIERANSETRRAATLTALATQIFPNWSAWIQKNGRLRQIASGSGHERLRMHPRPGMHSMVLKCRAGQRLGEHVLFCLAANHLANGVEKRPSRVTTIDLRTARDTLSIQLLLSSSVGKSRLEDGSVKAGTSPFPVLLNKAPLRRFDPEAVRRVGLIKVDHIGDAVMALPVIFDVRKRYPKAFILLIAASWNKAFFAETLLRTHTIDRIEIMDYFHERSASGPRQLPEAELTEFAARMEPLHLDLAIDLRRHAENRQLLDAIPARWKLSFGDSDDLSCLVCPSPLDAAQRDAKMPLGDELRILFQAHMYGGNDSNLKVKLDRGRARGLIRSHIPPEIRRFPHLLGLAPGAGHPVKRWPIERFAALADLFAIRLDAGIVWFGSRSEADEIEKGISLMRKPERALSLAGKISIMDFMHLTTACDVFIGNDSGPAHLTSVVGVPTLTVFSGQVSPFSVSSIGPDAFVLRSKPSCAPCYLQDGQCPYDRICLDIITPEIAFRAAKIVMATTRKD